MMRLQLLQLMDAALGGMANGREISVTQSSVEKHLNVNNHTNGTKWFIYLKKCTAGLASPISEVDPCGEASDTFSSQADITSSANIPAQNKI